jgi:aspartate racemase
MEQEFYRARLAEHGLTVTVPNPADRELVHRVIYDELCLGEVLDSSRDAYARIVTELAADGAEAVIFGCTEIGLLLSQKDVPIPVFDTTLLHVEAALTWALS